MDTSLKLEQFDSMKDLHNLIEKAAARDSSAIGEIYNHYFEPIYRFLYYRTSHKETAEDLTEEVFIKVTQKIDSIKDPKSFEPWLYRIARNQLIDHYRSNKVDVDLEAVAEILHYNQEFEADLDKKLVSAHIKEALNQLTEEEKLIIELRFFEKLDSEVVAELVGKSPGNIRVIQHRSLLKLKNYLNPNQLH